MAAKACSAAPPDRSLAYDLFQYLEATWLPEEPCGLEGCGGVTQAVNRVASAMAEIQVQSFMTSPFGPG